MTTLPPLHTSRQGERAVLCDVNPTGALDLALQQRLWALAAQLAQDTGVRETVPGMNNLLVILREPVIDLAAVQTRWSALWHAVTPAAGTGRVIDVPVRYGGPQGCDLVDVANACGLSVARYVELHAGGVYTVYALGSQPGFAYLGGLPPELAVPRRTSPRASVAAGTVMVGGAQTAVQSRTTPSGWHMLGMSDLQCFDPQAEPPVLLAPGDQIRFVVASVEESVQP